MKISPIRTPTYSEKVVLKVKVCFVPSFSSSSPVDLYNLYTVGALNKRTENVRIFSSLTQKMRKWRIREFRKFFCLTLNRIQEKTFSALLVKGETKEISKEISVILSVSFKRELVHILSSHCDTNL